jgi:hypothetical protein
MPLVAEIFETMTPAARAELDKQIEELAPSAAVLTSLGFAWQLAAYLAAIIKSGAPDLSELRSHGLPLKTAISIAQAISARHARKAAASAALKPQAPKPAPAVPAPKPAEQLDSITAASQLHALFQEAERGRPACLTTLVNAGWTEKTSRELKKIIDASLAANRGVKP